MEEKNYSEKYKKTASKLALGLMIFVIIIGSVIIGVGLFLAIYFQTGLLITMGSIMAVVGVFDILLAIRFYLVTKRRIAKIRDEEAIERYKRIHGIK